MKKVHHPAPSSVKTDPINAKDFIAGRLIYCCEQCSHYDAENEQCTIGYVAKNHLRETNLKTYELTGRMALCRFLEID